MRIALVVLALVVVVVGLLYGLQRRLIYFPDATQVTWPRARCSGVEAAADVYSTR